MIFTSFFLFWITNDNKFKFISLKISMFFSSDYLYSIWNGCKFVVCGRFWCFTSHFFTVTFYCFLQNEFLLTKYKIWNFKLIFWRFDRNSGWKYALILRTIIQNSSFSNDYNRYMFDSGVLVSIVFELHWKMTGMNEIFRSRTIWED